MARRFDSYKIKRGDNLGDPDLWNRILEDVDLRVHSRELDGEKIDEAVEALTAVALQRIDQTFTPVLNDAIDRLASVGALFEAESLTSIAVGVGTRSFVLTEATRAGYVVTEFVGISATAAPQNGMVAEVVSYDRAAGLLVVDAVAATGSGTFSSWKVRISAPPDLAHETRTDNPHLTTAAQVGAYTTAQVDALLSAIDTVIAAKAEASALASKVDTSRQVAASGLATGGGDLSANRTITVEAATQAEAEAGSINTKAMTPLRTKEAIAALANSKGLFFKTDAASVAFTKTGNGTATVKAGTAAEVNGKIVTFATATSITMPTLAAGTDYAIYVCDDGSIRADSSFSAPSGYTTTNSRQIGGFHYAPGGNAAAQAGGNTTAQINEFSLWDLKWRPACADPRGMALVAGNFWCDIYLTGVDHHVNGTSKYNVTIADGSSPPKIPTAFGGNGTSTYGNMTWWVATEVLASHGKQPLSYQEFAAAAYGTTEATQSGGSDVPTTGVNGTGATSAWNVFTSRWGIIQSSGCVWIWGADFGGGAAGASWVADTGGRGSTYQKENVALWGGSWDDGAFCGSRCSNWGNAPTVSYNDFGVRGRCDHLRLA